MVLGQIFHELLVFARPFDGEPAFGGHGEEPVRARATAASNGTETLAGLQLTTGR